MILAGDIGGTKVNLAWFSESGGALHLIRCETFASRNYPDFDTLLDEFLAAGPAPRVDRACFGVAGPVEAGRCRVTHLPWVLETSRLQKRLGTGRVHLINDLAATAAAVPFLSDGGFRELQPGSPAHGGRIAVLSAGTGLGQAFLVPDPDGRFLIVESEGGQADYPARTPLEAEFLEQFRSEAGRVSIEYILSGPGLVRLERFFRKRAGEDAAPVPAAEAVALAGIEGRDPVCLQALEAFTAVYGAVAGNLALQVVARGGVYLGGGIAPKLLPRFRPDLFLEAFCAKGEFREFMAGIPVRVLQDEALPLWGAAHFALGEKLIRW